MPVCVRRIQTKRRSCRAGLDWPPAHASLPLPSEVVTVSNALGVRHCHRCGARLARDNARAHCAACQQTGLDRMYTAPDVPAEFWEDGGLQAAFAARHMGKVIRAYRYHEYHGRRPLPQDTVASWFGITQSQLSRVEAGSPIVHLD